MDTAAILLLALLTAIAVAAPRYAADTRDGYDWRPMSGPPPERRPARPRPTPWGDAAALTRRAARFLRRLAWAAARPRASETTRTC
jgi:hypothetical protein